MKYILAIDQGTTGSRAYVFDHLGRIVSSAYREHAPGLWLDIWDGQTPKKRMKCVCIKGM